MLIMVEYRLISGMSDVDWTSLNAISVFDGILFNTIRECADYCGEDKQAIASWLRHDSVPKFLKDRGLRYA